MRKNLLNHFNAHWIFLLIGGYCLLGNPPPLKAVFVPNQIIVENKFITLDHLFQDLPSPIAEKAPHIKVISAPEPETDLFIRSRQLLNIAKQHRIPWTPTRSFKGITIRSAGNKITAEQIGQKVLTLLPELNSPSVVIQKIPGIYLSASDDFTLTDFSYNPQTHIFTADVTPIKEGHEMDESHRIYGRVHTHVNVPVPNRVLHPGDMVTTDDFIWISMDQKNIQNKHITDLDTIIGLVPRRILRPHTLMRKKDFKLPIAIKKGTRVPIIDQNKNPCLVLKAKALENGCVGETISFESADLQKILKAKVIGPNQAQIG